MYFQNISINIENPTIEPISLTQAKEFLRVDDNDNNDLIQNAIIAARESAENYTKTSFVSKKISLSFTNIQTHNIKLPYPPIVNILSIKYYDVINHSLITTLTDSEYNIAPNQKNIFIEKLEPNTMINIEYIAGIIKSESEINNIPFSLKCGMLSHISKIFDSRGGNYYLPKASRAFYNAYRNITL